jgi:hypothetical protein
MTEIFSSYPSILAFFIYRLLSGRLLQLLYICKCLLRFSPGCQDAVEQSVGPRAQMCQMQESRHDIHAEGTQEAVHLQKLFVCQMRID